MKADENIASIFDEFESNLRAGNPPRLDDFVRRAPAGYEASVCSTLVSTALAIDAKRDSPRWIDQYLCTEMWRYRREVCEGLTAKLYVANGGQLARKLGVAEFGEYRAQSVIGFGGFGTLFKAFHNDDRQKMVAVKVAHRDKRAQLLLKNEIRVLGALAERRVTGVPRLVGWETGREEFLITNWINGVSLDTWRSAKTPKADLLTVARQLATIVDRLHSANCFHGDISPGNIMVSENRGSLLVHLVDFGNAMREWQPNRLETITRRYAAPELLLEERKRASASSDIWSLGVVVFELLSGNYPFGGISETASNKEWGEHLLHGPLGTFKAPTKLWDTLIGCLSMDPELRLRNCTGERLALAIPPLEQYISALSALPDELSAKPADGEALRSKGIRFRQLAMFCVLIVLLGVIATIWFTFAKKQPTPIPRASLSATPRQADEDFSQTLGTQFRLFQPVKFTIGSPGTEAGRTAAEDQRTVELWRPFYLSVYDVTRGDFATFVDKTGYQTDADKLNQNHPGSSFTWRNPGCEQTDAHPVVMVSWLDAIAFCDWLSKSDHRRYRLPLESEWEYACRGGSASYAPFNTGENLGPDKANIGTDTFHPSGTTPVGHFKANAFGLFDMHGNVFQWCYTAEPDRAFNQVMYPDQQTSLELNNKRVMRGGSWLLQAVDARSASRTSDWAQGFSRDRGFRIVLEPLTK